MNVQENLRVCCVSGELVEQNTTRTWLFIMDAYESLDQKTETSLLLMDALMEQGQRVLWTEIHGVYLNDDGLRAGVREVSSISPFGLGEAEDISLSNIDAVLLRKDPPFDSNYLHLTYLLDHLDPDIAQFNRASSLRNLNEKLLPLKWPHLTPKSIVTMSMSAMLAFLETHGEIVVKPLDDCSGRGVKRISTEDTDPRHSLAEAFADEHGNPRYLMAQVFLPAVAEGDKRVFLVNGEVIGAVNRVPAEGSFLANIHQGAVCEETELTKGEMAAIAEIGESLRNDGIVLAGVDFIGGLITEINITSPSALRQINEVSGGTLERDVVTAMIAHVCDLKRNCTEASECCLAAA